MVSKQAPHVQVGFTMMELLVALVIVGLLAALVGPVLYQRINPAKQSTAKAQLQNFSTALDTFFVDNGRFPTAQEQFEVLVKRNESLPNWQGPYLKKLPPKDPWGNPYHYIIPGEHSAYDIVSYGADGAEGGEGDNADISSWQTN
ncbi:MAG: type II secretion system major pseudopilin GspG [Gammaproteobacteria bacterium]|nr:type II secretion system major pseudopilin GspG [Gammaproteobacteria bacterium]